MSQLQKLYQKIVSGTTDKNIAFEKLRQLLIVCGFTERIKGSHHIFTHPSVEEIVNIQKNHSKEKPYQVKQIRELIFKYKLRIL